MNAITEESKLINNVLSFAILVYNKSIADASLFLLEIQNFPQWKGIRKSQLQ